MPRRHKVLTHGQERLFRKVISVFIHSFVEWLVTFSYVLRPADVTVKEVNHIRCFAIDIAKDLILLSCRLAMEHLQVRVAIGDSTCNSCHQLQHTQVFLRKTTGKEYKIFCNVNCKTSNVVYRLVCHVCGSQYVGESDQPFNKRMNGHRSDFMKKTLLPVSQHFVSPGHSLEDFGRSKKIYH